MGTALGHWAEEFYSHSKFATSNRTSKKPIIVKRLTQPEASTQPEAKPSRRSRLIQESENLEQVQQIDIEQPEQPEPVIQLQSVAEPPIDQSIYGSGWSVAELMNEFSGRYDG